MEQARRSRLMTVREAAEYLNIERKGIYRLMHEGRLPGSKIRKSLRFKVEDVEAVITRGIAENDLNGPPRQTDFGHDPD